MCCLRIIIIGLLLSWAHLPTFCQTFPCDGSLLFSTNTGRNFTNINKVYFGPFGLVSFGQIKNYSGANFNGLGFNSKDNYIYAVQADSNEIVRIKADNSFEVIGNVPNVDKLTTTAGDCTPDGYYLCHDQVLDQILVFEVVDNFALVNQIDLFWDPSSTISGPFSARIDDFAIDPTNPTVAYSFQGNYFDSDLEPEEARGYLLKINLDFQSPDLGMVTPIKKISADVIRKIGSLIFSENGVLYAYGSASQNPNHAQNQLLRIDKFSGDVNKFAYTGPSAINSDGCSCPYSLSFTNLADPNFALCTDSKLSYTLVITNRTFQDIPNTSLVDTLAEGMLITNVSGNFNGNFAAGTGIGTRILQLDNLEIKARSQVTITINAEIIDVPIDLISNQAFLTNLPVKFGYDLVSDDPATTGWVGDATKIFSDPPRLEEFTIGVTKPTDCLKAEDGRIVISAPALIPGIEYEVNMRNEKYVEFARKVITDAQHTFVLDSLFPGEYTIYKITPKTSRCSFAMKDTTVTVEAPNELIQAEAFNNSPICEGAALELSATVFPPEGTVQWSGPNRFESIDLNITVDTAVFEQSGLYEMVFSYGFCEQVRAFEVEIAPDIEARISSQDRYCERDTMRLNAEGAGKLSSFIWTDPAGVQFANQVLEIPFAGIEQEGLYEVIIDNGYCKDTTSKFITISPTPTLTLPPSVKSDFCTPLVLTPELSGDTNVSYAWSPEEGLSCSDCPKPKIVLPFNDRYQLNVINEFACQDSADVFVLLDKEGLLYTPNVFSPNYDGVNDYFQVFPNCGVASIDKFQIFDRFGALVYALRPSDQFSNPRIFWNGYVNNLEANLGVYVWQLEITLIDGTRTSLTGDVTLVR